MNQQLTQIQAEKLGADNLDKVCKLTGLNARALSYSLKCGADMDADIIEAGAHEITIMVRSSKHYKIKVMDKMNKPVFIGGVFIQEVKI